MQLEQFFKENLILLDQNFATKEMALMHLAKHLVEHQYATDAQRVYDLAIERESQFSTGIGNQIAIPHIRDEVMQSSVITFAKIKPLEWQALDEQPVEYIFFITLTPSDAQSDHLEIIAQLSSLFLEPTFVSQLKSVQNYEALITLIKQNIKVEKVPNQDTDQTNENSVYDVVAVTACPTGIAHTFMARDMLNKAAQAMNIKIKVETQGTDGSKNALTTAEIQAAKAVIIAVDRTIDLSRFRGHNNVLEMGTKAVIKDAQKELQRALNGEGIKLQGQAKTTNNTEQVVDQLSFDKFGKRMYKSLLTGVSFMLPFVVFGGILTALAFLIDINNAGSSDYGTINVVAKWFKNLGALAFGLIVSVLCAGITYAIIGRQGILPGLVVGQIASGNFLMTLNPQTGVIDWGETASKVDGATSGVFGAVIGAFLAAAILIALSKYVLVYLPESLSGIKNILIIPLFGTLIVVSLFWIINIPIIYLNYGFTLLLDTMEGNNALAWLLGLVIGAMMAIDLGGPINKAAYIFGTTSLTTAQGAGTISMAAAMAAGMTPPLAIAFGCTLFKKLWTPEEVKAGMLNYVMGLTFISEGAIPFTVAKPKVLVPANIIGGAITGLIIGIFSVSIAAPHGGILTIALAKADFYGQISNSGLQIGLGVVLFIVAILAGSIVGMFMIVLLNKIYNVKDGGQPGAPKTRIKEKKRKTNHKLMHVEKEFANKVQNVFQTQAFWKLKVA